MRKVDHLITLVRQRTKNGDYSSTTGISQQVFVEILNEAQAKLQATIAGVFAQQFISVKEISIVGSTEAYTVPDRLLFNGKIISVEYSQSGQDSDYCLLERAAQRDRKTIEGIPTQYVERNGQILLNYIPSSTQGTIRVTYYRKLDDLDIERATVNGTPSGTTIVTSNADITSSPFNFTNLAAQSPYICISDKYGTVLARGIVVSSWSSPNITTAAAVSTYLESGVTLANLASGSITFGQYSTTFSKLPDDCERFLKLYCQKRIMTLDESNTSLEEDSELKEIEGEIRAAYADETRDVEDIPVLDEEIMW